MFNCTIYPRQILDYEDYRGTPVKRERHKIVGSLPSPVDRPENSSQETDWGFKNVFPVCLVNSVCGTSQNVIGIKDAPRRGVETNRSLKSVQESYFFTCSKRLPSGKNYLSTSQNISPACLAVVTRGGSKNNTLPRKRSSGRISRCSYFQGLSSAWCLQRIHQLFQKKTQRYYSFAPGTLHAKNILSVGPHFFLHYQVSLKFAHVTCI